MDIYSSCNPFESIAVSPISLEDIAIQPILEISFHNQPQSVYCVGQDFQCTCSLGSEQIQGSKLLFDSGNELFHSEKSTFVPSPEFIASLYRQAQCARNNKVYKSRGLNNQTKQRLKTMKVAQSEQSCAICQQRFAKGDLVLQLPCKHIFHKRSCCLGEWLRRSTKCPLCKLDIQAYFSNN